MANTEIKVQDEVVQYAQKHGKKAAYLFNNRLFSNVVNPRDPDAHKAQYDANWLFIKSLKD